MNGSAGRTFADEPVTHPAEDVLDTGAAGGKAIRGGVIRIASYIATMGLSLISVPIMVRHLGVADYGRYVTVSAIIFILGGVTEAGLTNLGLRQYAQYDGSDRERYLRVLTGLRVALTTVGVAAAVLLTWVTGASLLVVYGTAITGVGLLLALTQQTYAIPLTARLRFGWVSGLELLKQGLLTGTIVALAIAGASLLPFFAATVVSSGLVLVVTLVVIRNVAPLVPRVDLAAWRSILAEVLPYALAAAVGLIYFRLAVIIMSYIASEQEAGFYATAFRIVEAIGVFPWIAVSSGFPILARAARDDAERLRYALQRLFEVSLVAGGGFALVIALGAPFAIEVVAGERIDEAVPLLRMLGLALVTSFLVATWSFALLSIKGHRALLVSNALAAFITAAGVVGLEPALGAYGAAIATVAGEASLAAAYLVALRRAAPELTPGLSVVPKVLAAAALGGGVTLLPWSSMAMAIVGGILYLCAAFALRAVPPELVNALLRREPKPA